MLGSGTSLALWRGKEDVAIAVNGAANVKLPYQYFMCGDGRSPQRDWFRASEGRATRLIAAFLTPYDPILYPSGTSRLILKACLKFSERYAFTPPLRPRSQHAWFRYEPRPIAAHDDLILTREPRPLLHGATISGVALQVALVMGAAEIALYGCDLDGPESTDLQRVSLARLIAAAEALGVPTQRVSR